MDTVHDTAQRTVTRNDRIIELHEQGWAQRAIGEEVGVGKSTVDRVLAPQRNSADLGQTATPEAKSATMDEAIEADNKVANKESTPLELAAIAKDVGCSQPKVSEVVSGYHKSQSDFSDNADPEPTPLELAQAEDLLEAIAAEAKERQLATLKQNQPSEPVTQTFVERPDRRSQQETAHKAATMFGTNRTYVNQARKLRAIESERAKQRQREHGGTAPGVNTSGNISTSDNGRARDTVAKQVGIGSGRTYDKANKVWESAKELSQAHHWWTCPPTEWLITNS